MMLQRLVSAPLLVLFAGAEKQECLAGESILLQTSHVGKAKAAKAAMLQMDRNECASCVEALSPGCATMFNGNESAPLPAPCIGASRACQVQAAEFCGVYSTQGCRTVEQEDACFKHIRWVMQIGIVKHPAWYPGLSQQSSFEEIQAMLHERGLHECPVPCKRLPETLCHTAVPGEECFLHTTWAMQEGTDIFPLWYPAGHLKNESSFEDFQAWLHEIHHGSCPMPCMGDREPTATASTSKAQVATAAPTESPTEMPTASATTASTTPGATTSTVEDVASTSAPRVVTVASTESPTEAPTMPVTSAPMTQASTTSMEELASTTASKATGAPSTEMPTQAPPAPTTSVATAASTESPTQAPTVAPASTTEAMPQAPTTSTAEPPATTMASQVVTEASTESPTQVPTAALASTTQSMPEASTTSTAEVVPAGQEQCSVCKASCAEVCNDGHQFVLYSECWGSPRMIKCECRDGTTHTFEGCPCEHSQCQK